MSDVNEEVDDEVEEASSVRAHLDEVIDDSDGSELDDFDTPLHDEETEEVITDAITKESTDETSVAADVPATSATDKPPLDWGVEVREEWKNIPDSVKAHLHARDQHVNTMLQDGASNRKMGEGLNQIASGYKAVMDAEGVTNPLEAVNGLFKSVATLRMGTQQEKAQKIAQFVQLYGVDINALDNALVGNGAENAPQHDPMAAMIDERMAPVNQLLAQMNQNKQYQEQNQRMQVNSNIEEFAKTAEFLEDVRDDMADLLEGAARRNHKMTLQQAYDKACAISPQISNVINTRSDNNKLMGHKNNIAAKRIAASSINGNSSGQASGGGGGLRGALMSAFDDHA